MRFLLFRCATTAAIEGIFENWAFGLKLRLDPALDPWNTISSGLVLAEAKAKVKESALNYVNKQMQSSTLREEKKYCSLLVEKKEAWAMETEIESVGLNPGNGEVVFLRPACVHSLSQCLLSHAPTCSTCHWGGKKRGITEILAAPSVRRTQT